MRRATAEKIGRKYRIPNTIIRDFVPCVQGTRHHIDIALDEDGTILWLQASCKDIDADVAEGFSRLGGKTCAYYKSQVLLSMHNEAFSKTDFEKMDSIKEHEFHIKHACQNNVLNNGSSFPRYVEPVRDLMLEKANLLARSIADKVPVWIVRPDANGEVPQREASRWENEGKKPPARPEVNGPFEYALCFAPDGRGSQFTAAVRLMDGHWQIFTDLIRKMAIGSYAFVSSKFKNADGYEVECARGRTRRTGRHRADCILCGITPKMPLHSHTQTEDHVAQFLLTVRTITERLSPPKKGRAHEHAKKNKEQPRSKASSGTGRPRNRFIAVGPKHFDGDSDTVEGDCLNAGGPQRYCADVY